MILSKKRFSRGLQQAFVQDNESPDNLDLNRLNFDPNKKAVTDANLLDLLKEPNQDPDSGHGTDPSTSPGQLSVEQRASKLSVRKNVQVPKNGQMAQQKSPKPFFVSDSSSCGGYESAESEKEIRVLSAEHIHAYDEKVNTFDKNQQVTSYKKSTPKTSNDDKKVPKQKKSFWQKLTANLKSSNSS